MADACSRNCPRTSQYTSTRRAQRHVVALPHPIAASVTRTAGQVRVLGHPVGPVERDAANEVIPRMTTAGTAWSNRASATSKTTGPLRIETGQGVVRAQNALTAGSPTRAAIGSEPMAVRGAGARARLPAHLRLPHPYGLAIYFGAAVAAACSLRQPWLSGAGGLSRRGVATTPRSVRQSGDTQASSQCRPLSSRSCEGRVDTAASVRPNRCARQPCGECRGHLLLADPLLRALSDQMAANGFGRRTRAAKAPARQALAVLSQRGRAESRSSRAVGPGGCTAVQG